MIISFSRELPNHYLTDYINEIKTDASVICGFDETITELCQARIDPIFVVKASLTKNQIRDHPINQHVSSHLQYATNDFVLYANIDRPDKTHTLPIFHLN
jgi:hypothetical protein